MNEKVKVAVIDSGLDIKTYTKLFHEKIDEGYSFCTEEKVGKENDFDDFNGHGTACAVKIKELAPNVTIVPIKILCGDGRGTIECLIRALELVSELDVQVVNMSVSSDRIDLKKTLSPVLDKIIRRGITCIASESNTRNVSIPAEMKNVIGVGCSKTIYGTYYKYREHESIQMLASGVPELLGYESRLKMFFKGNSRATAIITGLVAQYISNQGRRISKEELSHYLKTNSEKGSMGFDIDCNHNEIQAVVKKTISQLVQDGKIQMTLENDDSLNDSNARIKDLYTIVETLEHVFDCKILGHTTLYVKYFKSINYLSRLVEACR